MGWKILGHFRTGVISRQEQGSGEQAWGTAGSQEEGVRGTLGTDDIFWSDPPDMTGKQRRKQAGRDRVGPEVPVFGNTASLEDAGVSDHSQLPGA